MKRFSEEEKQRFKIDIATGIFLSVAVFVLQKNRGYEVIRCLSDAFFVAGVLLAGMGGINFAKGRGAFDVVGYGVSHIFATHYPNSHKDEDLYAYQERKKTERKSPRPLILSGVVYLMLAMIFTAVFYIGF